MATPIILITINMKITNAQLLSLNYAIVVQSHLCHKRGMKPQERHIMESYRSRSVQRMGCEHWDQLKNSVKNVLCKLPGH